MNAAVTLVTVELPQPLSDIAREEIADPRVEWVIADGGDWLTAAVTREDR
jgi:spermidine synthase